MRRRLLAVVLAASAALSLGGLAPAYADGPPAPTLSNLSTATPGHLTGTITSPGAPYVAIQVGPDATSYPTHLTLSGDSDSFDVATWGFQGETPIYVWACTYSGSTSCSAEVLATTVTPTDVIPDVAWSSDLTVGPSQPPTATVTDSGGGILQARWYPNDVGPASPLVTYLNHNGDTAGWVFDGSGRFHVFRCRDGAGVQCVEYPDLVSPTYLGKASVSLDANPISSISVAYPRTTVQFRTNGVGTYDLDWHLVRDSDQASLPAPTGSVTGQPIGADGILAPIVVDGTGLADDTYIVVAHLVVHDPDYGTYDETLRQGTSSVPGRYFYFYADQTPPSVASITFRAETKPYEFVTTLYPNVNTQPDRPGVVQVNANSSVDVDHFLVEAPDGHVVRVIAASGNIQWSGRDATGAVVPSGRYKFVAADYVGNAAATVGYLNIDTRHRVTRTWTRTIRANSHLLGTYVGRCSTMRRPSARGWAGSLGYYANTRCGNTTWRASAVSTLYGIYLPSNVDKDLTVRVFVYGGAAKSRPRSYAGLRYLNTSGMWQHWTLLTPNLGLHPGIRTNDSAIYKDRAFYWGLATEAGDRFDVKSFTVELKYYALVP